MNGYFVLKWLLQNTSLSHHLNNASQPDFWDMLENSRACHSEIKEGLAVWFQSASRERLNALGGGTMSVCAHMSSKTTAAFNKVVPAAQKWHFLTLAEPYLIRVLVSTILSQQGQIHRAVWGNQKRRFDICPINCPLPVFPLFRCNACCARYGRIDWLWRATSPNDPQFPLLKLQQEVSF